MSKADSKTLTASVVDGRPGYVDDQGQVFATPKSGKRIQAWVQRMTDCGYVVLTGWRQS